MSRATVRPRLECLEGRTVPSTTVLTVAPEPGTVGQAVTLTATVTDPSAGGSFAPGRGTPAGTVTFFDGSTQLGPPALVVTAYGLVPGGPVGVAQLTVVLPQGTHSLTAQYSGEFISIPVGNAIQAGTIPGSTSDPVPEVINPAPSPAPRDVTGLVSITVHRGPRGRHALVTVRNVSGQTIPGPLFLVLGNLPRRVRLRGATGTTQAHASGSPLLEDNVTLLPGGSLTFVLSFRNPLHKHLHFTSQVFAGSGTV
jgi:hypothetical protein